MTQQDRTLLTGVNLCCEMRMDYIYVRCIDTILCALCRATLFRLLMTLRRPVCTVYACRHGCGCCACSQCTYVAANKCCVSLVQNSESVHVLGHYSKTFREAAIVRQVGSAASSGSLLLVHLVSTGI